MHEGNKMKMTKQSWIAVGVLGVVAAGGITAVMLSRRAPASVQWFGFEIFVESRGLDEPAANGKPLRWSVSQDNRILASGLAETRPHAVDAAKSAIEGLAEARAVPTVATPPSPGVYAGEHS